MDCLSKERNVAKGLAKAAFASAAAFFCVCVWYVVSDPIWEASSGLQIGLFGACETIY